MLQFWKKPSHNGNENNNCSTQKNEDSTDAASNKSDNIQTEPLCNEITGESDKGCSRLSKTLQDILVDKKALEHFIQYMDSRNAASCVLCWLDIESYKHDILQHNLELKGSANCRLQNIEFDNNDAQNLLEVKRFCDINQNGEICNVDTIRQHIISNAVTIFKKYIMQQAPCSIDCANFLRNNILESLSLPENALKGDCFDQVQDYIYRIMETFFETFMGSSFYCKYQIDVLTSGNVVLEDVLQNETALFYFMEFLEQKNSRNLLDFWIAATNLQQQLYDQKDFLDPVEAQSDAVVLYDKYFSLQAHCPLGLGDEVRFMVEQNICGEHGLNINCFAFPLKIVEQNLEKNHLKSFLDSHLFYKYLSELISSVQTNDCLMNIANEKNSTSSCSSEKSYNTNVTFLALDVSDHHVKKSGGNKAKSGASMTIDTKDLCDPDSLWKRKHSHSLSCGRITPMGRFETDLEPEPDKKEFNFKTVVKSFVQEDKKKEEMAWQVAEMIVREVTNMTLNQNKSDDLH